MICESLESFNNFHSFIVHLLFQEFYSILTFLVAGVETHTYHWKCWLLLYLLDVCFVGQGVDDLFGSVIQRGDDPFSVKLTWSIFWQGTGCKLVFGGGIPARSWLWPLMLCSVKDRWEDGMNQYMSTAQMVQSCSIHSLISYPSETEINNPFITGNSCQPAERSDCDLGWNCLQGFLAARKLDWMLVLKSWLKIDRNFSQKFPECGRSVRQPLKNVGNTAPAMEHTCRGRFGAKKLVGWAAPLLLKRPSGLSRNSSYPPAYLQPVCWWGGCTSALCQAATGVSWIASWLQHMAFGNKIWGTSDLCLIVRSSVGNDSAALAILSCFSKKLCFCRHAVTWELQLIAIYACLFFKACNPYSYGEHQAANLKKIQETKKQSYPLGSKEQRATRQPHF